MPSCAPKELLSCNVGEHPIARVCHTVCSVLTKSKSGSLRTEHLCTSQEVEGAFHELRDIEKDLVLDFPDCQSAQTLARRRYRFAISRGRHSIDSIAFRSMRI